MPESEAPRDRARRLRSDSTKEEQKLWAQLRAKRFAGFKFRRQHSIGPYFADFCCIARQMVIELDGGQHFEEQREREDRLREDFLNEQGYRVIRFGNNEVNDKMESVLDTIFSALNNSESRAGKMAR